MASDLTLPPESQPAPARGNFVLLRAGTLRLLLPQSDVAAAQYLEFRPAASDTPGLLRAPDADADDERVFTALSEDMQLLPECPPGRFVACRLARTALETIWCWDELRVLIGVSITPLALPAALRGARSPVRAFTQIDGEVVFLCTADELCRFAFEVHEAAHVD